MDYHGLSHDFFMQHAVPIADCNALCHMGQLHADYANLTQKSARIFRALLPKRENIIMYFENYDHFEEPNAKLPDAQHVGNLPKIIIKALSTRSVSLFLKHSRFRSYRSTMQMP
jgi:hypothetical protein